MNLLLMTVFAVASLSVFPTKTFGLTDADTTSDNNNNQEQPKALPLSSPKDTTNIIEQITDNGIKPADFVAGVTNTGGELWEENDHEVLIRNERGANKNNNNPNNNGGGGPGGNTNAGKKERKERNFKNKQNDRHNQNNAHQQTQQQQQQTKHQNTDQLPLLSEAGGVQQAMPKSNNKSKKIKQNKKQINLNNNHNDKMVVDPAEDPSQCRYTKSPWTECDAKSNTRSRTLSLKKVEPGCVPTRTIQKKCKKACRYEKGTWSECITGKMARTDKLKTTSDSSCQATRVVDKNCNPGKVKGDKKEQRPGKNGNKDKANRKSRA